MIRRFRGVTQKKLGEDLGFGSASEIRISQYESNSRHPKSEMIVRIAEMLDVNPNTLDAPVGRSVEEFM